ncbi:FixH family protein [Nocardia heshunensis]
MTTPDKPTPPSQPPTPDSATTSSEPPLPTEPTKSGEATPPSKSTAASGPTPRARLAGRNGLIAIAAAVVAIMLVVWWVWPSDGAKPVARSAAGPYLVQLRVDSAHTGDNTVDLDITDQRGDSAAPDRVSVEPAMPQMGHALPPSAAGVVTPGHYRATVNLPMPGQWEIAVKLSGAAGSGSATFSVQAN